MLRRSGRPCSNWSCGGPRPRGPPEDDPTPPPRAPLVREVSTWPPVMVIQSCRPPNLRGRPSQARSGQHVGGGDAPRAGAPPELRRSCERQAYGQRRRYSGAAAPINGRQPCIGQRSRPRRTNHARVSGQAYGPRLRQGGAAAKANGNRRERTCMQASAYAQRTGTANKRGKEPAADVAPTGPSSRRMA